MQHGDVTSIEASWSSLTQIALICICFELVLFLVVFHVGSLYCQEFTTMEKRLVAMAEEDGRSKEDVKGEEAKAKAVIAAKAGSIAASFAFVMGVVESTENTRNAFTEY